MKKTQRNGKHEHRWVNKGNELYCPVCGQKKQKPTKFKLNAKSRR